MDHVTLRVVENNKQVDVKNATVCIIQVPKTTPQCRAQNMTLRETCLRGVNGV